jgi:hypothetical protein
LSLTLKPPIPIDFGSKGPVTNLTEGFVYTIVTHIISVQQSQYVGGDRRRGDVEVVDSCGVYLAMVGRAVK